VLPRGGEAAQQFSFVLGYAGTGIARRISNAPPLVPEAGDPPSKGMRKTCSGPFPSS
jgi:hypothetical protein